MKKKVIATLVSAMMLATVLAGCGAATAAPAAEPEAKEETTEVAEVKTDAAEEAVPASDDASGDVTIWYYWETAGHQEALDHRNSTVSRTRSRFRQNMFRLRTSRSSCL